MNKKHSIMVGLLAGGLLFSTNTAEAAMTTGNSNTTSEAKTVVAYQWISPYILMNQFNMNQYNWKDNANFNCLINAQVNKNQTATEKKTVTEKPAEVKKEPVKTTPVEKTPVENKQTPVENSQTPVTPTPAPQETASQNNQEVKVPAAVQEVVDLTNKERAKEGLKALQIDVKLTQSAQAKSQDMKNNNYFSHTSPTYGSPFDQMKSLGITYKSAGENIAMGQRSAAEVVKAWMESPGHRENIMNPSYTHIGVGLSDSGYYWTQQFIGK